MDLKRLMNDDRTTKTQGRFGWRQTKRNFSTESSNNQSPAALVVTVLTQTSVRPFT